MTTIHTLPIDRWQALGGLHTAKEIAQQPEVWRQFAGGLAGLLETVRAQLSGLLHSPQSQVILTGAGTSAFIGELICDTLDATLPAHVRAVATTSLLSHPTLYFRPDRPLLLVSFARSGNSPESQAAVELARKLVPGARFLNITCNGSGDLALAGDGLADTCNVVLPDATCDRSFAMTSSYTTMVVAALALLGTEDADIAIKRVATLATLVQRWISEEACNWQRWGQVAIQRLVYLGAGPLEALAREASLKVMELTGGRVLSMPNSPLGFRHGPKSMLNAETLVVVFRSQDPHARLYDADLLAELRRDNIAGAVLEIDGAALGAAADLPDAWMAVAYITFAQVLALHQSVRLGLTPDNPFPDGTVNRVVQGVTIHGYASV